MMRKNSEYVLYTDLLRIFSMVLVVLLHIAVIVVKNTSVHVSRPAYLSAVAMDAVSRCAVPLFVMVSGALLLGHGRDETPGAFLARRIRRAFFPFIVWTVLYVLWWVWMNDLPFLWPEIGRKTLAGWATGRVVTHLWFIPMLMSLYLATPILRVFIRREEKGISLYLLSLCFLFAVILPLAERLWNLSAQYGVDLSSYNVFFNVWIGYFVLGYVLNNRIPRGWMLPSAAFLAGWFGTAAGTYLVNRDGGAFDDFFERTSTPNVLLMATGAFCMAKWLDMRYSSKVSERLGGIVRWVSQRAFGIYLVHVMVINVIRSGKFGFALTEYTVNPVIGTLSLTAVSFLVSLAIVSLFKYIPFVRYIVP